MYQNVSGSGGLRLLADPRQAGGRSCPRPFRTMSTLYINTVDNAPRGRVLGVQHRITGVDMIVIVGLVILLAAAIVGVTGVLTNAGPAHRLTENFIVFGYHVTGSTGTSFLFGIVVGAVGMLGLSVFAGRCSAHRGPRARRPARTQKLPSRNGAAEPRPRQTARGAAVGAAREGADTGPQPAPVWSLVARSTTDRHCARRRSPVGTKPRSILSGRSRGLSNHLKRRNPQ
jgi:hypothetical protein